MAEGDSGRHSGGATKQRNGSGSSGGLSEEFQNLLSSLSDRAVSGASQKVSGLTDRLTDIASDGGAGGKAAGKAAEGMAEGKSPVKSALSGGVEAVKSKVSDAFGGGGGGGGKGDKKMKVTNIIEEIDVGAPVDVVYDQWTQFQDYSNFMKKVENVDQKEEQKLTFKAQILWSHRTWESTIVEQVPDKRIVWKSSGEKGHVDGAVTFHELGPELTRILVVLEYHPQGLFERTGNLWRAQGRRVRLELKHFRRQVMTDTVLHPDDVEGWRGEIHDSEVTKSHEEAQDEGAEDDDRDADDEYEDEDEEGEAAEDADDEFEDEDEPAEDEEDEAAEDEYEDEEPAEEEEPVDEDEEDEEEPAEDEDDEQAEYADDDEGDAEEEPAPRRSRSRAGRR